MVTPLKALINLKDLISAACTPALGCWRYVHASHTWKIQPASITPSNSVVADLYAANQVPAFVLENFVTVEKVQVVQFVQFSLQFTQVQMQLFSVRFEAVSVVLRWKVTLSHTFVLHRTTAANTAT